MSEKIPCPNSEESDPCDDARKCPSWYGCHMGIVDGEDDFEPPSIEDEYEDLVEDMMLYPQDYSVAQIEMVGLTLDDVYPDSEDIDDE